MHEKTPGLSKEFKTVIAVTGILTICVALGIYTPQISSGWEQACTYKPWATPSTPIDPKTDYVGAARASLAATAVPVRATSKETTFIPGGPFTPEVFNKVRDNTFIITYSGKSGEVEATGILLATDDPDYYYVATTPHKEVDGKYQPKTLTLYRPYIDGPLKLFVDHTVVYTVSDKDAVIFRGKKSSLSGTQRHPLNGLEVIKAVERPIASNEGLVVGYPDAMRYPSCDETKQKGMALTMASIDYTGRDESYEGHSIFPMIVSKGNSGGPFVKIVDGEPKVTDLIALLYNGELIQKSEPFYAGTAKVDFEKLMAAFPVNKDGKSPKLK